MFDADLDAVPNRLELVGKVRAARGRSVEVALNCEQKA
jgi:hypothetical protein